MSSESIKPAEEALISRMRFIFDLAAKNDDRLRDREQAKALALSLKACVIEWIRRSLLEQREERTHSRSGCAMMFMRLEGPA